ncbi:unnamed protein product [Prunus brigantina]
MSVQSIQLRGTLELNGNFQSRYYCGGLNQDRVSTKIAVEVYQAKHVEVCLTIDAEEEEETKGCKEEQWEKEKKSQQDELQCKRPVGFVRELKVVFCSKVIDHLLPTTGHHMNRVEHSFDILACFNVVSYYFDNF